MKKDPQGGAYRTLGDANNADLAFGRAKSLKDKQIDVFSTVSYVLSGIY